MSKDRVFHMARAASAKSGELKHVDRTMNDSYALKNPVLPVAVWQKK